MGNRPSQQQQAGGRQSLPFQNYEQCEEYLRGEFPRQPVFIRVQGPDGVFVYRVHQHPGGGLSAERFVEADARGSVMQKVEDGDYNTVAFRHMCRILFSPNYRLLDIVPDE